MARAERDGAGELPCHIDVAGAVHGRRQGLVADVQERVQDLVTGEIAGSAIAVGIFRVLVPA